MDTSWHLAIDFGTSNSAAAHTPPSTTRVEALALTHRSNIMPSAVFIDGDDSSTLLTGDTALSRGRRDPSRLLLSPKRYIDHDNVQLAGQDISLHTVVGAVIGAALKAGKSQHAGQDPASVTLTHPEAWSAHSVDQLKSAATKAGISSSAIRTISEPRAAAIHYASQQRVSTGGHVAVFDFGGGTLDVAVLKSQEDGNFKVVAAKGDNSLGGRTIDNLLYRWVLDQIDHNDPDRADELRSAPMSVTHALEANIREAKEMLSDTSSTTISVSTPTGETDILITREEFNGIIEQSIQRGVELTQATLSQAGVDSKDTPIYMTGGSSRIPFVQNQLGEVGTVMTLDDPKTVVSRGALLATLRGFTGASPISDANSSSSHTSGPGHNGANQGGSYGAGDAAGAGAAGAAGAGAAAAAAYGGGAQNSSGNQGNPFANATRPGTSQAGPGAQGSQNGDAAGSRGNQNQTAAFATPGAASGAGTQASGPSTNQYGSGNYSSYGSASTTSSGEQKKSKAPLIAAGVLVAALVIGGGAYALTSGGDESGNGGQQINNASGNNDGEGNGDGPVGDNGLPPFSEKNTLPDRSPSNRSEDSPYADFLQVFPDAKNFMPTNFYNRVNFCKKEKEEPFNLNNTWQNSPELFHDCLMDRNFMGEYSESHAFTASLAILEGEEAKKNYDFLKSNPTVNLETVQEAGNGWPEIIHVKINDEYRTGTMVIWYPEEQMLITGDLDRQDEDQPLNEEQQVKAVAEFFNFAPPSE